MGADLSVSQPQEGPAPNLTGAEPVPTKSETSRTSQGPKNRNWNTTETERMSSENEPGPVTDTGYWLSPDRDVTIIPSERNCFYCCEEGKLHPLENFACYPCCGYSSICLDCMSSNRSCCGECGTEIPFNENAVCWIKARLQSGSLICGNRDKQVHLLGRAYVKGCHTYLDELILLPVYVRMPPPSQMLAIMNPPMVQTGVDLLITAAESGVIAAMLDLADIFNTSFLNDPFQKDKEKAEYWHRRALGKGNSVSPLAFTRYGEFLKYESRFVEAKNMFEVAATFGHVRGQYEYARLLLEGSEKEKDDQGDPVGEGTCSNDETSRAIEWLCKASAKGYYIPSYLLLAKALIGVAEKEYGTSHLTGRSPLPRALQILSLVKNGGIGDSEEVQKESDQLLRRYDSMAQCCNCGATGSENISLVACSRCGVFAYCSKICQKRDFRDGHKFDCCSSDQLFDCHLVKQTLPWNGKLGRRKGETLPSLQNRKGRTLMEMVEDDTDETYGEEELDYDEHILAQLMLRMRKNLETFLDQEMRGDSKQLARKDPENSGACDVRNRNLKCRIDAFAGGDEYYATNDLIVAMHKIREYGNDAAHSAPGVKLSQKGCEEAVRDYRVQKEKYQINKSKTRPDAHSQDKQEDSTNTTAPKKKRNSAPGVKLSQKGCEEAVREHSQDKQQEDSTNTTAPKKKRKPKKKKKKKKCVPEVQT